MAKKELEIGNFDVRAKDRYLEQGRISKKDLDKHVSSIEDSEEKGSTLETNQDDHIAEREDVRMARDIEQKERDAKRERLANSEASLIMNEE